MARSEMFFKEEIMRINKQTILAQARMMDRVAQENLEAIEVSRMEFHELVDQNIDNFVVMISQKRNRTL